MTRFPTDRFPQRDAAIPAAQVSKIAHDVDNLVLVLIEQLRMARTASGTAHPCERAICTALKAAEQVRSISAGLRADAVPETRVEAPVNLATLLLDVYGFLRETLPPSMAMQARVPFAEAALARVPAMGLRRVLVNLAQNAARAMPDGGALTLELAIERLPGQAAGHAVIAVRDTGVGMSPQMLREACRPRYTSKADGRGSGWGLAIVREQVAGMGGRVAIESAEGQGTMVAVTLPLVEAAAPDGGIHEDWDSMFEDGGQGR
jgi:signal transduction histidine kinase